MNYIDGRLTGWATGRELCQVIGISDVWHNYRRQIGRGGSGYCLDHNRFGWYVRRATAFCFGRSAVVGRWRDGAFCVSHFCPASQREGRDLLIELAKQSEVVVFAVLPEMAGMLLRLGYQVVGETMQYFAGSLVDKIILSNRRLEPVKGG